MTRIVAASAALLASTALAHAGGIERSNQSMAILFEEGTYAELGFGFADPNLSGSNAGGASGDMAASFNTTSLSYRQDLSDNLSFAIIFDQHVGADVSYPTSTYAVPAPPAAAPTTTSGTTADVSGRALTALLRYETESNFSVYGGLRLSTIEGVANVPFIGLGYSLDVDGGQELGYVIGAAYEIPEIAFRVALTYSSEITHTLSGTNTGPLGGGPTATSFESTIPQSVMLEAQTGIAENTLLFGSARWVQWSAFDITPPALGGSSLVNYSNDTVTYTLGVGRRFNENWSGAVTIAHEPQAGGNATNLGPADGFTAASVGLTWENERFEVSGGVRYISFADSNPSLGSFQDNDGIAAGIRFGIRF